MPHKSKNNDRKRTDHPKSENVKVETEIKEKLNRVAKIERLEIVITKRVLKKDFFIKFKNYEFI